MLDQLFLNFTEEMVAKGAGSGDTVDNILWFNHGVYLRNTPSKLVGIGISRPMLENNPNLMRQPATLLDPRIALRVWKGNWANTRLP